MSLIVMVEKGQTDALRAILRATPLSTDTLGFLLLTAAEYGQGEVAELLLSAGADVNYLWNGDATPLSYAIEALDPWMILWLISRGANVHHRAHDDETFLHRLVYAVVDETNRIYDTFKRTYVASPHLFSLLLDHPIDVNAECIGGRTVLDMVQEYYLPGVETLIVARGGRRGSRIHHAPPDRTLLRDREALLLALIEAQVGPWHPDTATQLIRLAQVDDDDTASDAAYARALAIRERTLGADHPDTRFLRERLPASITAADDIPPPAAPPPV